MVLYLDLSGENVKRATFQVISLFWGNGYSPLLNNLTEVSRTYSGHK